MIMASYPTKLVEAFASQALKIYFQESVSEAITNNDYEGEIRDRSSKLNILTFSEVTEKTYTGANMTPDDPTESNAQLVTDQAKAFYFKVKSYDTFRSFIKNPENTIIEQTGRTLKKVVDQYVLGFYTDVASGQRIGTDYDTGTVTVDDTTGLVTGSGTTFTSAMVGKGFKATGHSVWYRVKTFTTTESIVIEDDSDDETSAYTGGAIAGGTAYTIEASTKLQITKNTVYQYITKMSEILDDSEIPEEDRFLVVSPNIAGLIRQAPEYVNVGNEVARNEVVKRGMVGEFAGFRVYKASTTRMSGNNTDGYHVLGGHKSAITYAMGLTENGLEDLIGNFGKAYKSLYVYGAKVPDERRKGLVEGFFYV